MLLSQSRHVLSGILSWMQGSVLRNPAEVWVQSWWAELQWDQIIISQSCVWESHKMMQKILLKHPWVSKNAENEGSSIHLPIRGLQLVTSLCQSFSSSHANSLYLSFSLSLNLLRPLSIIVHSWFGLNLSPVKIFLFTLLLPGHDLLDTMDSDFLPLKKVLCWVLGRGWEKFLCWLELKT